MLCLTMEEVAVASMQEGKSGTDGLSLWAVGYDCLEILVQLSSCLFGSGAACAHTDVRNLD